MSDSDERPEILDADTEREILYQRICAYVREIGFSGLRQDLTVGEEPGMIAAMAVTGVLRELRVMSGRQLAVLLAGEANRHARQVIHEPPRYTAEEIANVS